MKRIAMCCLTTFVLAAFACEPEVKVNQEDLKAQAEKMMEQSNFPAAKKAIDQIEDAAVRSSLESDWSQKRESWAAETKKKRDAAQKEQQERKAQEQEAKRISEIDEGLAEVDTKKCTGLESGWRKIKKVRPQDPQYEQAKKMLPKLEKCRKKSIKSMEKLLLEMRAENRKNIGKEIDKTFLSNRLDVKVKTSGKGHTKLALTHVFFSSRVSVNDVVKGNGLLGRLEEAGFSKVTFLSGFGERIWYDLDPKNEKETVREATKKHFYREGLGEPLALQKEEPGEAK